MKRNSWHAEAYSVVDTDLPDNWCAYLWGWIVRILLITLFVAVLIAYLHGLLAFVTHNLFTYRVSLVCLLGQLLFLAVTFIVLLILYDKWKTAKYPMPGWWHTLKRKTCKPISWED